MSDHLPDATKMVCPKCNAKVMASGENWTRWNCWAYTEDGVRINEAVPCLERQRDQLRTANAALVEQLRQLEAATKGGAM